MVRFLKVQVHGDEVFKDDLTGQLLPPDLVKLARKKDKSSQNENATGALHNSVVLLLQS